MKDFAAQAKLEMKKRGRTAKLALDHRPADVKATAKVKIANARDIGTQAGLEIKKRTRDAKLALDKSATGRAVGDAKDATVAAAADAKESVLDAVLPVTKTVEATSTRGVDITHMENARNERLVQQQREQRKREAKAMDKEQEAKRQQLLDDAKATVAEKTETIGAVLADVRDRTEVALGRAAVAAKDKLDEMTAAADDAPAVHVSPRTSSRGIDISAASNPRNAELLERDVRRQELAKAREEPSPTLGDKAAALGQSLKEKWAAATSDAPAPIFVAKQSDSGIDISHVENAANAELAAAEEKKMAERRAKQLAREKEALHGQLVEPAADDLGAKMAELGGSVKAAAAKLADSVRAAVADLTDPAPLDVHEKRSENGIDTTSIQNADNNAIGEQIRAKGKLAGLGAVTAPTKEQAVKKSTGTATAPRPPPPAAALPLSASTATTTAPTSAVLDSTPSGSSSTAFVPLAGRGPPPYTEPDLQTRAIKGTLDTAVAAREASGSAAASGRAAAAEVRAAGHEVKEEAKGAAATIREGFSAVGDKVAEKIAEVAIAPTAL